MGAPAERLETGHRLDAEWARVDYLVALAEASRTGAALPEDYSGGFAEASQAVTRARENGAWAELARLAPEPALGALVQLDLDILALALASMAMPSLAPRIQSLQPHIGDPDPSLALLQELLMLETRAEVDLLYERLSPTRPLAASGLIRVSGNGAYQVIRSTRAVARALLQREVDLSPPTGAHLQSCHGCWDDLVLPPGALRSLKDYVAWIRQRERVVSQWGLRRHSGPLGLFSGPSGCGKSYAASIIANELSRETGEPWVLYSLDLGRVMSKYIGETERNLNALLDAMDGRRAILQIDEADGLLGKRGEVSDARDRYANLEVSHMLSRFESHDGPVILTTNLRSNIDPAFQRRFQMVVDFPAPDIRARRRLWAAMLPRRLAAEREEIVEVAAEARLSGGGIRNACFYAAVLAADAERPLGLAEVARAVSAELNKDQRQIRDSELGRLIEYRDPPS